LPHWWKFNLDGTPRKTCQAPDVLKGVPQGETRQRETDLLVLKALHAGAETLVQVVASTGFVKVTCTRSLERLVLADRVLQSKAAPTGKRGRPAFTYRPTTEAVEPDPDPVDAGASTATGVEE
jgi:predicted ArsR family transcriptional regulator